MFLNRLAPPAAWTGCLSKGSDEARKKGSWLHLEQEKRGLRSEREGTGRDGAHEFRVCFPGGRAGLAGKAISHFLHLTAHALSLPKFRGTPRSYT